MNSRTVAQVLAKAAEFEENDKHEQAYECYKEAYKANQNDMDVLSQLAISAQHLGKTQEAVEYWNIMLMHTPENPLPYHQLMDIYFHSNKYDYYMTRAKLKTLEGRLDQSVADYKKALSNTTEEKEIITARYLLAQTYEIIEKPMQAIDEYLRILDYEHNENAYNSLAKIYYSTDKPAAANILAQALKEFPQNKEFKELLSKIYMELGKYEEALEYSTNNLSRAKILLLQEKNDEAFEILQSLSDKDKSTPQYFAMVAEYYYNNDEFDSALQYIEKYEAKEPKSPLASQMRALVFEKQNKEYDAHFNWGKYYLLKNANDLALNEFLNAYSADKNQVGVIRELINLYIAMDDRVASIEFSEKLVEIEKDDVPTLKKLVNFYEHEGYEEKTIQYLYALNEINPKDYETLLKLAKHCDGNRQVGEAINYYEQYLKFAPTGEEKEKAQKRYQLLTSGEIVEEEGFLDKIIGFFTKK